MYKLGRALDFSKILCLFLLRAKVVMLIENWRNVNHSSIWCKLYKRLFLEVELLFRIGRCNANSIDFRKGNDIIGTNPIAKTESLH